MAEVVFQSFEIERFNLEATRPLPVGNAFINERAGALVRATFVSAAGEFSVLADVSPLTGFSPESLETALEDLTESLTSWIEQSLPVITISNGLSDVWSCFVEHKNVSPSASWARFQIAVRVHAQVQGRTIPQTLSRESTVPTNVFYLNDTDGTQVPKFKVHSIEDVTPELLAAPRVRLDSNQKLSFDEAIKLAEKIGADRIVYWEEPLSDVALLEPFHGATKIDVALDESLQETNWETIPACCFVIKPTVLGWEKTMRIVRESIARNIPCVVSTAYESNIGRSFLKQFAEAFGFDAGLGRRVLFKNDFEQDHEHAISAV